MDDNLKERDYFGFKKMITIDDLFRARIHYGHKVSQEYFTRSSNKNKLYI